MVEGSKLTITPRSLNSFTISISMVTKLNDVPSDCQMYSPVEQCKYERLKVLGLNITIVSVLKR